ncbi:hypothetical protein, partial [Actinomyces sp. 186855]|uniref:hypothetical protein n=1 Tax=Actinomyces sp. 186855 TaxID=2761164 RepID=UPI002016B2D9
MNTEHDKINTYIATRTLEDGTVEYALGVRKKGLFYRWKGKRVEDIWPVWSADGIYRVMPIRPGNCSNR